MTSEYLRSQNLLLVLPLRAYRSRSKIFVDDQARNGLRLWLENFDRLILACPTSDDVPPDSWLSVDDHRISFLALPAAYTPVRFTIALPKMMPILRRSIAASDYLQFAIGGFWGDWGAVSSVIAATMKRPYAVWTDRVESEVIRFQSKQKAWPRRLYGYLNVWLTQRLERFVIRRAGLGLFHGMDCYTAYARYSKNPYLVDDIHIGEEDHITEAELSRRLTGNKPLHFVYAGRAHKDKGIYDWINVFEQLAARRHGFRATWFGDGPELEAARSIVRDRSLAEIITLPGPVSHVELLQQLKSADAFVFCHKTMESPRNLIEALACGLPLVGYRSEYASHLVSKNGGGILSLIDDIPTLASRIENLFDRTALYELSERAARDGSRFTADAAFRYRSELMKSLKSDDFAATRPP
jgi:colanic acid/amylovoran biosynthesis glycosyltransferase